MNTFTPTMMAKKAIIKPNTIKPVIWYCCAFVSPGPDEKGFLGAPIRGHHWTCYGLMVRRNGRWRLPCGHRSSARLKRADLWLTILWVVYLLIFLGTIMRRTEPPVPFRLGIFLRLRDAEQIAGAGDDDEEIVAEDDKPRRDVAHHARAAGALHHIHRGGDQDVAAESEDDGRGVQRAQAAERQEGEVEIERRKRELERDPPPDRETGDAPEHRRHGGELHRAHIVVRLAVDGQRYGVRRALEIAIDDR